MLYSVEVKRIEHQIGWVTVEAQSPEEAMHKAKFGPPIEFERDYCLKFGTCHEAVSISAVRQIKE